MSVDSDFRGGMDEVNKNDVVNVSSMCIRPASWKRGDRECAGHALSGWTNSLESRELRSWTVREEGIGRGRQDIRLKH